MQFPLTKSLQISFGWLIQQGLVQKDGKRYSLTSAGVEIKKSQSAKTIMKSWDLVTKKFETMSPMSATEDDVAENEVTKAYQGYKKWFWQTYRKLKGE